MKFKNPSLIFVRKDGQAQSNMPLQIFQSWVHKNSILLSEYLLTLTNSVDPDEMQHYAAFHLGLHCLQKYLFRGLLKNYCYLSLMVTCESQNHIFSRFSTYPDRKSRCPVPHRGPGTQVAV